MDKEKQLALIMGGSSGLGLKLALLLTNEYRVIISGRRDPKKKDIDFNFLDLGFNELAEKLDCFVASLPSVYLLIYAAGFYQEGRIDDLNDTDIMEMNAVGLLAPAMLLKRILKKQGKLNGFIAITSTSQWKPRILEPMYTAVKAGLGMLANSISLDPKVNKVLVASPAGMATRFWENHPRDLSTLLDPHWVAEQILEWYKKDFEYKVIRILREPPRVEEVETR